MKLLIGTSELSPFIRSGGLGDAVAGLANALAGRSHDVTVAIPFYSDLAALVDTSAVSGTPWRSGTHGALRLMAYDDADLFDRAGLYGPRPGSSFDDNWLRFARFSAAVAALAGDFEVAHFQDAHVAAAAMAALAPTVLTLHNAGYPIIGPLAETAEVLGAPEDAVAPGGTLEWYGGANLLKAGVVSADVLSTVSPTHAIELTGDETSFGLGGVIRARANGIRGVLNGIDAVSWDPAADASLPTPFSSTDLSGRAASRANLLEAAGLSDGMLFGNVGRMSAQKGFALIDPIIGDLVRDGFRIVLVGNGELDELVDGWAKQFPEAVAHLPFTEELARLVSAGADSYLMPSQYEPCGLGQIYAMRYGAVPVANPTGGLVDTVVDIDADPASGTGFLMTEFSSEALEQAIRRAMDADGTERWTRARIVGMTHDWSWDARAAEYEQLYEDALDT